MRLGHPFVVLGAVIGLFAAVALWPRSPTIELEENSAAVPAVAAPPIADQPQAVTVAQDPEPAPEPREDPAIVSARVIVLDRLKDPESARFRNERALEGGERVCGEVNAKNAMGGYVGYSAFVVMHRPGRDPVVWIDSDGPIAAEACKV